MQPEVIYTSEWQHTKVCPFCFQVADLFFPDHDGSSRGISGGKHWMIGDPCPTCGKIDQRWKDLTETKRSVRIVYVSVPKEKKFLFWKYSGKSIEHYFEEMTEDGVVPLPKAFPPKD